LGVVLTLSNHEPFLLPSLEFDILPQSVPHSEYLNSSYHTDWALGESFHKAQKQSYFENTIFVLVADHGKLMPSQSDLTWDQFHIACLIYAPHLLSSSPKRISRIGSQTDRLRAMHGLLDKPFLHHSWGRDILYLPIEDQGFAMIVDGKGIGWAEDSYFLVDRIGTTASLFDLSQDPEREHDLWSKFPELAKKFQTRERSFL